MLICCQCHREMRCDKNSVGVVYRQAHVYPGDRFKCDECGWMIVNTNPAPIFDPERKTQDEYLQMPENAKKGNTE